MKFRKKYILLSGLILILTGGIYGLDSPAENIKFPDEAVFVQSPLPAAAKDTIAPGDSVALKFPVAQIVPDSIGDLKQAHPIDLKTPKTFTPDFQYNPITNRYELRSKIGDMDIVTPLSLTPEEYYKYSLKKSMDAYYLEKYSEEFQGKDSTKKKDALSMFDFKFDLGPADKIFGPGGVQLKANGSINTKIGFTRSSTQNPTLSERQKNRTAFDFNTQIQANVNASVGNKLSYDMNYNTESTFDFDTKKLKLAYAGKEDEIVKTLEAGNVSMNTSNSLIRGGAALFGIKTELQFGKLTVDAIFSQQESQSQTTSSNGNVQTTPFMVTGDNYDQNMHYLLGYYFFDNYDGALSTLPYIKSGVNINRIEVWKTNTGANFTQARNIVAFADLGENTHISNKNFVHSTGSLAIPDNNANDLYTNIATNPQYQGARDISLVTQTFASILVVGTDYEKIESACKLDSSQYTLNPQVGYISLRVPLQDDEVLAVAYSYTYAGKNYQVGEFSTDNPTNTNNSLYVKLLKGTMVSPSSPTWRLMMKNVYSITNGQSLSSDQFMFNVKYQNDTTGVAINYITEGKIANQLLLRVMNLDRLDSKNEPHPDGFFDFIEGQTVYSQIGKIIFPEIEPFGSFLRQQIANDTIADKYVFSELYDSTLTVARQIASKNKFILQGQYKGSSSSNINLGGSNIARGSVVVTANGVRLQENTDYLIDYPTGAVTIINPAYQSAQIQISSENQNNYGMQRKTMMGLNLNYAFNPNFNLGATIMNLSEMPVTMQTSPGEESVKNTLFGFNTNYTAKSQALTNLLDKIPFLEATAPSQITFSAEYARLIPGHYRSKYGGDYSYIDDFEQTKQTINLLSPYQWNLSSTPTLFPEAQLSNNVDYGKNRALLAWYNIDPLFTRSSSLTPTYLKNDLDQLSNHNVREVLESELFPDKDVGFMQPATISVLNLAYYPQERGPYNLDSDGMNPQGRLNQPDKRWGGIMRRIESGMTDFEANNYETIEFWLMDPFIYNPTSQGGDLYFELGDISEDILKDGKKFFENGLPANGDTTLVEKTVWGLVPTQQSTVYAFDNTQGARKIQDVGLDGLSNDQEFTYPTYANYLQALQNNLPPSTIDAMRQDPFSPMNDPAGDNYHYYRGTDYDQQQVPILGRYKRYNGTEGNSADVNDSPENYSTAAKLTPDVEDINQDNTLNETEKYFQYKVSIRPQDMQVGANNYIVQKLVVTPVLKNGKNETVTWYQFKIPLKEFIKAYGGIQDFKSIRFMRTFMTNFTDSVILRFGTFDLVRGDWRTYTQDLSSPNLPPQGNASISLSVVNVEESGEKEPVNYIMPPGVNRILDPGQPQLTQKNEQSLAAQITDLSPGDARAIYKSTALDTRQYRRIQMFSHAEKMINTSTLQDTELSVFLRLGSDYTNNYYEYSIPVKLTPAGRYVDTNDAREIVWPQSNMFDFPFTALTNLKLERDKQRQTPGSGVNFYTPYFRPDPDKPLNTVTVVGNPSISNIQVIMIGVRNNSQNTQSVEVWFDELRLTDFNESGGWAGNANLFLGLSDVGSVNFTGRKETAGFGSLDQGIMDRNLDDQFQYSISTQADLGRFFPKKAKVSIPFYYSYQEQTVSPKYNPLDQDILLSDALNAVSTKAQKDSIMNFAQDKTTSKSINFNNVKVDIKSKTPMPYDPANFNFNYSLADNNIRNSTTEYNHTVQTRLTANYAYSNPLKAWHPFGSSSSSSTLPSRGPANSATSGTNRAASSSVNTKPGTNAVNKFFQDIEIGYLPKTLSISSDITRNYNEIQLRDLNDMSDVGINPIPASFSEDFFWNRSLDTQWNLTKNLNLTFHSNTNARIETPYVQVNKKLNPDQYSEWKDSVWQSIRSLGTPMDYKQTFLATYTVPFQNIPILSFLSASLQFNSYYSWDKGAALQDSTIQLGNTIANGRTIGINPATINLLSLYNKSTFLEGVNKRFTPKRAPTNAASRANTAASARANARQLTDAKNQKALEEKRKKKFEGQVTLNTDSGTVVKHQLDNKRLRITARDKDGKLYNLKFKALDNNSILIKNKDSVTVKLVISQLPPLEENVWYKTAQVIARGLMMVRTVGFAYSESDDMTIPYFRPNVGNFIGQGSTPIGNAPGLDFAFGLAGTDYIEKANRRGWLINDTTNITPAMINQTNQLTLTAQVEPIAGMKVTLNANQTASNQKQYYFMYNEMPPKLSGNFQMTTISIGSAFESANPSNGYHSRAFDTFLKNRNVISHRLEQVYSQTSYPDAGFISQSNTNLAGKPYDPSIGSINANSADVLIPAFIAAYSGKNPNSVGLTAFPSLLKMLPNWTLTYDGLMQIPFINKRFKAFSLTHSYSSIYAVGAYNSLMNWVNATGGNGIGFSQNVSSNDPFPSSPYDISTVSITEAFNPLIGLTSTLLNNVSISLKYNRARNVNLNITSYQITEMLKNDFSLGAGYKFDNFNKVLKLKKTGGANFNNDLKVDVTVSYSKTQSLIRTIEDQLTQALSGDSQTMLKLSADYALSKMITLQGFFDKQISNPLISSTAYPLTKTDFGVNVRVNFTR